MKNSQKIKQAHRRLRRRRIRARIMGTALRPRLSVRRSLLGMYAQIIDDTAGKTLVALRSSSTDHAGAEVEERTGKMADSYCLGKLLAEKAKAAHITEVVFDRGGYRYHGRVQALAEGARAGGLVF